MATYSTAQVARILDIGTDTLHRWINEKKVPTPAIQLVGGVTVRLWSEEQLQKARKYMAKHYWGLGSKKLRKKKKNKK